MNLDQARDSIGQRVNVQLSDTDGPGVILSVPPNTGTVRVQTLVDVGDGHEVNGQILDVPVFAVELAEDEKQASKTAKKASK